MSTCHSFRSVFLFLFGVAALIVLADPVLAQTPAGAVPTDPTVVPAAPTSEPTANSPIPMMAPTDAAAPVEPLADAGAVPNAVPTPTQVDAAGASAPIPSLSETLAKTVGKITQTVSPPVAAPEGSLPTQDDAALPPGMDLPVEGGLTEGGTQKTSEEMQADLRREAFDAMMTGLLPLDPPEIREAITRTDINQKALEEPLSYPKPEVTFTTISLDPGATPMTLKLATGHVTTITFLDMTGEPWPIKEMSWAGNFEVKGGQAGQDLKANNLLRIVPLGEYAYGNLSLRLVGLNTPIIFTLRVNRDAVQYRLDIRVPENGPFALPPLIENGTTGLTAGDATLTKVMEGIPPGSAQKLQVSGVDGRTTAYRQDGLVYVRTPLTLLSPAWNSSVKSADGMNVYAINNAPVLLLSDQGRMVRASISDTEDKSDE